MENENLNEEKMLHLELEDGKELDCEIICIFSLNDKEYIVLLPKGEEEAYMYIYSEDENGGPILDMIETDEEYQKASAEFEKIMSENSNEEEGNEE